MSPRIVKGVLAAVAAGLLLGACASSGGAARGGYADDLAKLQSDCDARGGTLTPLGRLTGRAETDYACTLREGATRLDR